MVATAMLFCAGDSRTRHRLHITLVETVELPPGDVLQPQLLGFVRLSAYCVFWYQEISRTKAFFALCCLVHP